MKYYVLEEIEQTLQPSASSHPSYLSAIQHAVKHYPAYSIVVTGQVEKFEEEMEYLMQVDDHLIRIVSTLPGQEIKFSFAYTVALPIISQLAEYYRHQPQKLADKINLLYIISYIADSKFEYAEYMAKLFVYLLTLAHIAGIQYQELDPNHCNQSTHQKHEYVELNGQCYNATEILAQMKSQVNRIANHAVKQWQMEATLCLVLNAYYLQEYLNQKINH